MKNYLAIFFSLLILNASAQVEDHFNDGDFTNAPTWSGDNSNFIIDNVLQLQLNAVSAGNSYLSVPVNFTSLDSCEWHFFIHLDFSPSTSNYARVYLVSDQQDLNQPLNGYFLQFGESLSNDAIELFRLDGTATTSICRAQNGLISNAFSAGIKVLRNVSGIWTLSVDYSGSINYNMEATGTDTIYNSAGWMGVKCNYTSGNISKFYFDDFYAGPEIPDTISPFVVSVNTESDTVLSVIFSEEIVNSTLNNLSNYIVDNGIGQPLTVVPDTGDPLKYFLLFASHFQPGQNYTISFQGLKDQSQNILSNQSITFLYSPTASAKVYDVIFSEIYFEPSTLSPLPYSEYVEILNRSDSSIIISGWKISDGSSDGIIPVFRIAPQGRAVLYSENDSAKFSPVSNAIAIEDFPTLNNDIGDRLTLSDTEGNIIDEIKFNDDNYHDTNKNDGGWSIERIDPDFTCENSNNWKASISNFHGTPGNINSVNGIFSDVEPPYILNAFLNDSMSVTIVFSETINNGGGDLTNYRITDNAGIELILSSAAILSDDTVVLVSSTKFSAGIYTLKSSSSIEDCPGNKLTSFRTIKAGFPEAASRNDVIINELLFNCYEGGNDFVEIYNNSHKIIDLKDWKVAETDYSDSLIVKDIASVTKGHRLFFPGEYLVLSEDEKRIKSFYNCNDPYSFLNVSSMPDYNSDEGRAEVYDNNGNIIDVFKYSDEMHFPLISDPKGISLERLSTSEENVENINWHSAAATAGFATPGYGNSQRIGLASGEGEVSVGTEIFSPDNDGYNDVLAINYKFPQAGTVLSLNVFDLNGIPVRTILSGQTVANEGLLTWDGLTDSHSIAPSGIYILFARSFDLEGNDGVFKASCFLTRRF